MDPVERQVEAFNNRDLEGFIEAYAPDVIFEDGTGATILQGHDGMRALYGPLFAQSPDLHAEVVTRIRVGDYVVDEELGTGGNLEGYPREEMHVVAIYRLAEGRIAHVRLLM